LLPFQIFRDDRSSNAQDLVVKPWLGERQLDVVTSCTTRCLAATARQSNWYDRFFLP
jgi:hypothetical protein